MSKTGERGKQREGEREKGRKIPTRRGRVKGTGVAGGGSWSLFASRSLRFSPPPRSNARFAASPKSQASWLFASSPDSQSHSSSLQARVGPGGEQTVARAGERSKPHSFVERRRPGKQSDERQRHHGPMLFVHTEKDGKRKRSPPGRETPAGFPSAGFSLVIVVSVYLWECVIEREAGGVSKSEAPGKKEHAVDCSRQNETAAQRGVSGR